MSKVKFLFDLDGTLTKEETLPKIARELDGAIDLVQLTEATMRGNIPFIESFITRFHILKSIDPHKVADLLETVDIWVELKNFIDNNSNNCAIVTGNLDIWVSKLLRKFNCKNFTSKSSIKNGELKLEKILKKEDMVHKYQSEGYIVVMIGDGNNDLEAFRLSDYSIASGVIHHPSTNLLTESNYLVFNINTLCQLLNQIKESH